MFEEMEMWEATIEDLLKEAGVTKEELEKEG